MFTSKHKFLSKTKKTINKFLSFNKKYQLKTYKNQPRYIEAHKIKAKCNFFEKAEVEKDFKLKEENFALKSENLIKQQSLEKSALAQKMNSEYEEMGKVKQTEIDKIINKFKNKKFDLETKQGKEKNMLQNENLLKANIFNSNLFNYNFSNSSNNEKINSINKSLTNKQPVSVNKFNSVNDLKLKDNGDYQKKLEFKGQSNNAFVGNNKRASKNNLSSVSSANYAGNINNKQIDNSEANKSQKMFNYSGAANVNLKMKIGSSKNNLQYASSALN